MARVIARIKALDRLRAKRIKEGELDWELNTSFNALIEKLLLLLPQSEFDRITKHNSDSYCAFMQELKDDNSQSV